MAKKKRKRKKLRPVVEDVWQTGVLHDECGHVGCTLKATFCAAIHAGDREDNPENSIVIAVCEEHAKELVKCSSNFGPS